MANRVIMCKSQLLGIEACRGGDTGLMEDGSFVEGINGRWLVQVLL